jgi:hypothetical protein
MPGSQLPADPNIRPVLAMFVDDQRARLGAKTLSQYRNVLQLLEYCLDGYGSNALSTAEEKRYRALKAKKPDLEFCDVFGPDKIIPEFGEFLGYFMVRKVIAGQDLMRAAGTVTKKLAQWLGQKGHVEAEEAEEGRERGGQAARELPKAARLADVLNDFAEGSAWNGSGRVIEGRFELVRVEPGRVWIADELSGEAYGVVKLPEEVSRMCQVGWSFSGQVERVGRRCRIVEVWNVYPR